MSLAVITRAPSRPARAEHPFGRAGEQVRPHGRSGHPPAFAPRKQHIVLDQGLICFIGRGSIGDCPVPRSARWLAFSQNETSATLSVGTRLRDAEHCASNLVIAASRTDCERAFGYALPSGHWYLPSHLRAIAAAITDAGEDRAGRALYLRAKGLELVCETVAQLRAAALVPCCGTGSLSEVETRRLMAARDLIEARLHDALSLNHIAKACGLNRTKLTQGFRQLNGVSVATFICNARMLHAKTLLLTTDLPVAMVGFRCGYRSNASFARAFVRHHRVSPLAMRSDLMDGHPPSAEQA